MKSWSNQPDSADAIHGVAARCFVCPTSTFPGARHTLTHTHTHTHTGGVGGRQWRRRRRRRRCHRCVISASASVGGVAGRGRHTTSSTVGDRLRRRPSGRRRSGPSVTTATATTSIDRRRRRPAHLGVGVGVAGRLGLNSKEINRKSMQRRPGSVALADAGRRNRRHRQPMAARFADQFPSRSNQHQTCKNETLGRIVHRRPKSAPESTCVSRPRHSDGVGVFDDPFSLVLVAVVAVAAVVVAVAGNPRAVAAVRRKPEASAAVIRRRGLFRSAKPCARRSESTFSTNRSIDRAFLAGASPSPPPPPAKVP